MKRNAILIGAYVTVCLVACLAIAVALHQRRQYTEARAQRLAMCTEVSTTMRTMSRQIGDYDRLPVRQFVPPVRYCQSKDGILAFATTALPYAQRWIDSDLGHLAAEWLDLAASSIDASPFIVPKFEWLEPWPPHFPCRYREWRGDPRVRCDDVGRYLDPPTYQVPKRASP